MTINYQYRSLRFEAGTSCETAENVDFELLFRRLVEGDGNIVARCSDVRGLMGYLHRNYIFVKAAGGIVEDVVGRRLLMMRNGRCDLPKGKVEQGETLREAALRETNEETGLQDLRVGPLLLKTYHIYDLYGGWHFKQTSWYAMQMLGDQRLVPQSEEGITELLWLGSEEWKRRLQGSYATMRLITEQVPDTMLFTCGC